MSWKWLPDSDDYPFYRLLAAVGLSVVGVGGVLWVFTDETAFACVAGVGAGLVFAPLYLAGRDHVVAAVKASPGLSETLQWLTALAALAGWVLFWWACLSQFWTGEPGIDYPLGFWAVLLRAIAYGTYQDLRKLESERDEEERRAARAALTRLE
jgi:hypothetical protein